MSWLFFTPSAPPHRPEDWPLVLSEPGIFLQIRHLSCRVSSRAARRPRDQGGAAGAARGPGGLAAEASLVGARGRRPRNASYRKVGRGSGGRRPREEDKYIQTQRSGCLSQYQIFIPIGIIVAIIIRITNSMLRYSGYFFIAQNPVISTAETTIITMRINLTSKRPRP